MKQAESSKEIEERSYAILRARCVWNEPTAEDSNSEAITHLTTAAVATTWQRVLATHKIRCNFVLDAEDVIDSNYDDRAEALLQNVAIHSGFDLNLCENQSDNVLMHSSRPSVLHLSFTSCYLVVGMATLDGTEESSALLHLPVTPDPWDFSWSPDPTSSLLAVDMNLTRAREMFEEELMIASKRHEETMNGLNNGTVAHASTTGSPDPSSCVDWVNLQVMLESEMKGIDTILGVFFTVGFVLVLLLAWMASKGSQKKVPSTVTSKTPKTRSTPSSICVNMPNDQQAMSPVSLDSAIKGTKRYASLEEAWYKSRAARQRNRSHHEGKRFLQPSEDRDLSGRTKDATSGTTSPCDRKVMSKLDVRKTTASKTKSGTPDLIADLPPLRNAQQFINKHWGC